jgi:hypothetical protein
MARRADVVPRQQNDSPHSAALTDRATPRHPQQTDAPAGHFAPLAHERPALTPALGGTQFNRRLPLKWPSFQPA